MTHAIREAVAAFRRTPILSFLSAAMVALALTVVGLFGVAAYNLQTSLDAIEERVELVVYLRDDAGAAEVEQAVTELREMDEVASVTHVTRDEALARAREDLTEFEEVFADLEVNPLPASLEVQLQPGHRTPDHVASVAEVVGAFPVAEDIRYGQEWVERLFFLRRVGAITTAILGGGFALAGALIIGTAVRMAVFARQEEIYVMRLVGATNGFIRRPFLLEGAFTGFLGSLLAAALTGLAYLLVDRWILPVEWLPPPWVVGGVAAGTLLGVAASGLAVRRYLRRV